MKYKFSLFSSRASLPFKIEERGATKYSLYIFAFIWRLLMPIVMAFVGSALEASARPANVFVPHLSEIQNNLPPGFVMRLPSEIKLSGASDIEESKLFVRVFSSETPGRVTVSVSTCDRGSLPCLIGSFSADGNDSVSAVRELQRHKAKGDRITLAQNIVGYLLEGPKQRPQYRFSSVMWEQDGTLYTVTFPEIERQNILFMAYSMARETPLRRIVTSRSIVP